MPPSIVSEPHHHGVVDSEPIDFMSTHPVPTRPQTPGKPHPIPKKHPHNTRIRTRNSHSHESVQCAAVTFRPYIIALQSVRLIEQELL